MDEKDDGENGGNEESDRLPTIYPQIASNNVGGRICDGPSAGPLRGKCDEDGPAPQFDAAGWAKALLEIERDPDDKPIRLLAAARMRARREVK